MIRFLAHFLFVLAAWTVTIKFAFPVCFALWEGVPAASYVLWDLWWAIHLWLGWSLLHWRRYTYAFALVVAATEVAIIGLKFASFLAAPEWTMWTANWFINKLFVLACFSLMLLYFTLNRDRLRRLAPSAAKTPAGA